MHKPAVQVPAAAKQGPGGVLQLWPEQGSALHLPVTPLQPNGHVVSVEVYVQPPGLAHVPVEANGREVVGLVQKLGGGVVHGSAVPVQVPPALHVSPVVHTLPSLHEPPVGVCV